jgi:hypothetical protein
MISPRTRLTLLGGILFLAVNTATSAQDLSIDDIPPGLRNRAIIMDIVARVVEQDQKVVWNSENSKITIPGRPVGLTLVGANIIIAIQFTPFFRPSGNNFLVAQGQIWINNPDEGLSFHTTIQTIPMEFEELIYFFPLGSNDSEEEARIEIELVLYPYNAETVGMRRGNAKPP